MSCRAPFPPTVLGTGTRENLELLDLCDAFARANPPCKFMSKKADGHVMQVKHVQHALRWWDNALQAFENEPYNAFNAYIHTTMGDNAAAAAGRGRGRRPAGAPRVLPLFDCPATDTGIRVAVGVTAKWATPGAPLELPGLLSAMRAMARRPARELPREICADLDNITLPVCDTCNHIMDSDEAQRDLLCAGSGPLVPLEAIQVTTAPGAPVLKCPTPDERETARSYRHAMLAYYLHRCLLALSQADYDCVRDCGGLGLYTRLCYLTFVVAAKRVALGNACASGVSDHNARGQLDLLVSYLSWLMLKYREPRPNERFDFYRYHIFYASEVPRCARVWPATCPRSLGQYVFTGSEIVQTADGLVLRADAGVTKFTNTIGMLLRVIQCRDDGWLRIQIAGQNADQRQATTKRLSRMRAYFATAEEGMWLMVLQGQSPACIRGSQGRNPAEVIKAFGVTAIMLPFYHYIWKNRPIRDATWKFIREAIHKEWDEMRTNNEGWFHPKPRNRGQADLGKEEVRLAYNLAFCAGLYAEANRLREQDPDIPPDPPRRASVDRPASPAPVVPAPPSAPDGPAGRTRARARAAAAPPPAPAPAPAPPPVADKAEYKHLQRDRDDVKYMVQKWTTQTLTTILKETPLCSVWKTSLRLMGLHALTFFNDAPADGCVAFIEGLE